ncbi:hypothetical protein, partial [uncultured Slackia sp.]|uniref:hypothetical protein n=1 Tax=uncultured Slackia sp. TaxID=665903 RepID=UPI00258BDCE4
NAIFALSPAFCDWDFNRPAPEFATFVTFRVFALRQGPSFVGNQALIATAWQQLRSRYWALE